MGAWIETIKSYSIQSASAVAPHVGAWIETADGRQHHVCHVVAPHVGAWIETPSRRVFKGLRLSRPTWARGLKHRYQANVEDGEVAPHVGAWIETASFGG